MAEPAEPAIPAQPAEPQVSLREQIEAMKCALRYIPEHMLYRETWTALRATLSTLRGLQEAQSAAQPAVYVCPTRDIECGPNAASWCSECPLRRIIGARKYAAAPPAPAAQRPAQGDLVQRLRRILDRHTVSTVGFDETLTAAIAEIERLTAALAEATTGWHAAIERANQKHAALAAVERERDEARADARRLDLLQSRWRSCNAGNSEVYGAMDIDDIETTMLENDGDLRAAIDAAKDAQEQPK